MLFCHITTKLKNDPDQDLLGQKSSRVAFPTLLFMDQQGTVLAKQGERSVPAFRRSVRALESIKRLEKAAAEGDQAAKSAMFIARLNLGKFDFRSAKAAGASLQLTTAQQGILDATLVNLEVDQIYADARKNGSFVQLGDKFLVMKNAGRVPTSKYPRLRFWTQIMNLAQKKRDAKLYAEAMKAYHQAAGNSKTYQRIRDRHAKVLEALRAGRAVPVPTRRARILVPNPAKKKDARKVLVPPRRARVVPPKGAKKKPLRKVPVPTRRAGSVPPKGAKKAARKGK